MLVSLCQSLSGQGLPGVGIGIPGVGVGVGVPANLLADYPNPYANKAPAYRSVYLFKPSEMGSYANKPHAIRSIYFNDSVPQGAMLQNFTIRMKMVPWDTMPLSIPDAGLETVVWPRTYVDRKGLNEHTFDVPFCWDGVSNFIVDICVQNLPSDKSYNAGIRVTIPDTGVFYSYHDWNMTGNAICLETEQVQPKQYEQRPETFFAGIPKDTVDLRMYSVASPADLLEVNTANQVKIRFQNYSCSVVNGAKLGYRWNNDPPVIETYPSSIQSGEYLDYTFIQPLLAAGDQFSTLKIWTQHTKDNYPQNDTISFLVFVKDGKFEGLDYTGKEFWVAFMQNFSNVDVDQKLFITSTVTTAVTVEMPLLNWSTTATVLANQVSAVTVPKTASGVVTATEPGDTISPTGIHITSSEDISVYGYSGIPMSADAYLAIPRRTLGRKYTVTAPTGIYNPQTAGSILLNAPAEFIVIGTEDNTKVSIITSAPSEKYAAGDTIITNLSRGQTYMVKAKVDFNGLGVASNTYDLTGSRVIADKKVGLIGGSQCALIPGITQADKCQSCDHLLEMLTPPSTWGTSFYSTDFDFKPGEDVLRLVNADSLPTAFTINGVPDTIPANGFRDKKFSGEIVVLAKKPVQAIQMCTGGQCTTPTSSTDPFITTLIPETQWGNYYTFSTTVTPNLNIHYINIVKKSKEGRTAFNGYRIPDNYYKKIPGTEYYACKIPVNTGSHKVSGDSVFYVTVYGFGKDNSYGYPASGSFLKVLNLPQVYIDGEAQNISCYGAKNGHIKVDGFDGTPPYGFYWNDGVTGQERSNLDTGKYWVFVEDDYGYQDTAYFTITQPDSLQLTLSSKNLNCFLSKDGEITTVSLGGTPPIKYLWNDGDITANRTLLAAASYSLTITDSLACKKTKAVTLSQPAKILVTLIPTSPSCNNGVDGKVKSTVVNGFKPLTYNWTGYPAITADSLFNLPSGAYSLLITDTAGCTGSASTSLTNPSVLGLSVTATNIGCFQSGTGKATAIATGGGGSYQYLWNNTPGLTGSQLNNLSKGWYVVVANDGRCSIKDSIFVDSVPSPAFVISTITASCGKPNGTATVSATGGSGVYQYNWETNPPHYTVTANNVLPGDYKLFITDGVCTKRIPFTINDIPGPSFIVDTNQATCGLNNGTAALTNIVAIGTPVIKWYTNPVINNDSIIYNLKAGTYNVEIKDSICTVKKPFTITRAFEIRILSFTKRLPDCNKNNGRITVVTSGGMGPLQISWNTIPVKYGATVDSLVSGIYEVTISDGTCTITSKVTIASRNGPAISLAVTHPKCDDSTGKIVATVTGGSGTYAYSWNGDPALNTKTISNLPSGSYSLLVDDGLCLAGIDTVLPGRPRPQASLTAYNASCGLNNGAIKAVVSGPVTTFQHYWNGVIKTDSIFNLASGNYQYAVYDGTCWVYDSIILQATPAPMLTVASIDSSYCGLNTGKAFVTASGGSGIYNITWATNPVQYGDSAVGLLTGTYTVHFTDFNCIDSTKITIPERLRPSAQSTVTPEHCDKNDASVQILPVIGANPFSISWFDSPSSSFNRNSLDSGWYYYTLTDQYCYTNDSVYLGFSGPPTILPDMVTPAHCALNNGAATVVASSPNGPFQLDWRTNPAQVGQLASNLAPGSYYAVVSDQYCSDSIQVVIADIPLLILTADTITAANCGIDNGRVVLSTSGGQGPYLYSWTGAPTNNTSNLNGIQSGWIAYSVSDDYCTVVDSVFVPIISKPSLASLVVGPDWCGKSDGFAKATITGGTGNYTYKWIPFINQNSDSINNLAAGNYSLEVTDGGCVVSFPFQILRGYAPKGQLDAVKQENCNQRNGSAMVNNLIPSSSTAYWPGFSQYAMSQSNLSAGTYSVILSNGHCDTTVFAIINNLPGPLLQLDSKPDTCGSARGVIQYSSIGGTPPYQFFLAGQAINGGTIPSLGAGSYQLSMLDANQCPSINQVDVENIDLVMPGGSLYVDPQDPIPGDELKLKAFLPSNWLATNWYVDYAIAGNGQAIILPTSADSKNLQVSLHTIHRTGCIDSLLLEILLLEQYSIFIPNTFTPDGDGYNEFFFPVTAGIKAFTGKIFDRWGEEIFTFTSLTDRWDGTYSGEIVKSDTYLFRMVFVTNQGKKVVEEGTITLLK